ncbi:MAG: hypothetical protein CVU05_09630 [Bacteroidetes bacterium HGW-Bacteroidetes-21]|nr:MAG: hypothetical protein CVU05_09630 [Bacteroidetes bacterium HGW-Bacteroidetes-21]
MKTKSYFNEWFSFSASEKNGILILLILIFILSGTYLYQRFSSKQSSSDFTAYETEIALFNQELKQNEINRTTHQEVTPSDSIVYFEFDPNTISPDDLVKMGFSRKNAETLNKYRNNKGRFFKKEDFKKLYFVNDSVYSVLEPYIRIETAQKESQNIENKTGNNKTSGSTTHEPLHLELNTADTLQLDQLKGIGPSFAARIVKYRNRLGGYSSKEQLLEVYGFTNEMLEAIQDNIYINPEAIQKLNINTATFKDLIRHPYLTKDKVIRILDYLKVMKKINNLEELVKNKILDANDYEKLKWYFSFD